MTKNILEISPTICLRKTYATHQVHTPKPSSNTAEGLANNPLKTLIRKNSEVVIQHPEIAQQLCTKPKCENVACSTLCEEPLGPLKSVAMLSHSDVHGGIPLSTEDIDGDKTRIQFYKIYQNPHETSNESADPQKDVLRTQQLHKIYFGPDE